MAASPRNCGQSKRSDNQLRLNGTVEKRLFELAVLVIACSWTAEYEWFAREEAAERAGVESATIEAVRLGKRPVFERADERIVYQLAFEVSVSKDLSASTYKAAESLLGLDKLVELVTVIVFYTMVAVVVKAFDSPVPGDAIPLPNLSI